MKKFWIFGLLAGLILVACQSSAPLHQYTKGSLLTSYDFSTAGSFEEGAYGAATMQVINGDYEIDVTQGDDTLWWGQWGDSYSDTIIDVDTEQLSDRPENAYGVMCRVRGDVGQPQPTDATLAAIMHEATTTPNPQATALLTAQSTAASTEMATAASTIPSTAASTAVSVTQSTAESTAASTKQSGLAGLSLIPASTAASTAESTAASTSAATVEASNTSTSAATATTAATAAATSPLQLPTLALSPTPLSTLVPANEGDGYVFLLQGGGSFGIFRSSGRNLTPLVDWKTSSAINQGPADNHIQVICAGNYLAFYVNNQFLGDATDNTYASGQVGLAASAATRLGTRIAYDNLTVSAAVQSK